MKCENCGRNQANVKYTQIINGEKKQMFLCEECSQKLGIGNMQINMPIDFSSFLGDFFDEMEGATFIPTLSSPNELKCRECGLSFDEFMHTGKFGCSNCYEEFETRIDPIIKNIQGSNRHIGRIGKITKEDEGINKEVIQENNELDDLKEKLKLAIQEERYEDAAKFRDEIKEIEKSN